MGAFHLTRGCWILVISLLCCSVGLASSEGLESLKNVCTAHFQPLVNCHGEDAEEPEGYHISLFKVMARSLNMTDFKFKCLPFGEMMDDLLAGGKECDIGIGGITLTSERMRRGLHFSFPTYRGSLGILVKGKVRKGATWSFLQPLHWTLWAAIGATSMIIPIIVFFTESFSCHGFIHRRDLSRGLKQAIWDSYITLLNFGSFTVKSQEARLIVIGYGFLVLILVNTYVANLAAFLTITNIDSSIKTLQDLFGKNVIAGAVYERRLLSKRIGVTANFTSAMKDIVVEDFKRKNEFDAVIYDEPWISHHAALDCGLFTLSDTLSPFDYAFALPNRSKAIEEIISKELIGLQETGQMSQLSKEFVQQPVGNDCPVADEVSETESVDFNQLKGLWIILACCVGLSLTSMFVKWASVFSVSVQTQQHNSIRQLKRLETTVETVYHPHAVKVHAAESMRAMSVGGLGNSLNSAKSSGLPTVSSVESIVTPPSGELSMINEGEDWQRTLDRFQEDIEGQIQDIREFLEVLVNRMGQQKVPIAP